MYATRANGFSPMDLGKPPSTADISQELSSNPMDHNLKGSHPTISLQPIRNTGGCAGYLPFNLHIASCASQQPSASPSSFTMAASSSSSPRSGLLYYAGCEEYPHQPHFLEACFLCQKPLGNNADIFMYRGNTPFCSKECRQEQMEFDEAKEKSWNMRSLRKSDSNKSSSNKAVRSGTVAVA
ncbi:hypothetical protein CK203_034111 [Vitis vinifera]|uniref:FLZ-type domain-containing protein n=2 Tax=Vitis vinifera TaxID=29760 RepID=A0A438IES2_VITVI|nr:hypothetical protein CK203_034111 [Vitis vinifera]